jgi:hypothetical protein
MVLVANLEEQYTLSRKCRDVWGSMPRQDSELDLCLFDRLAIVSREPDAHVDELRALDRDERVSVPGTVFNAVLNCMQEL